MFDREPKQSLLSMEGFPECNSRYSDIRKKMNDSLHDFVLLSESSARANLIQIASGRNT